MSNKIIVSLGKAFEMNIISKDNYSEILSRYISDYKLYSEIEKFLEYSVIVQSVTTTEQFEVFKENVTLRNFVDYYYDFLGEIVAPGASKAHKMACVAIFVMNGVNCAKQFASRIEA